MDIAARHSAVLRLLTNAAALAVECERMLPPPEMLAMSRRRARQAAKNRHYGGEDASSEEEDVEDETDDDDEDDCGEGGSEKVVIFPGDLQQVTQYIIEQVGIKDPDTLERITAVYMGFQGRVDGLNVMEFRGYVACILTQGLRELEDRCAAAGLRVEQPEAEWQNGDAAEEPPQVAGQAAHAFVSGPHANGDAIMHGQPHARKSVHFGDNAELDGGTAGASRGGEAATSAAPRDANVQTDDQEAAAVAVPMPRPTSTKGPTLFDLPTFDEPSSASQRQRRVLVDDSVAESCLATGTSRGSTQAPTADQPRRRNDIAQAVAGLGVEESSGVSDLQSLTKELSALNASLTLRATGSDEPLVSSDKDSATPCPAIPQACEAPSGQERGTPGPLEATGFPSSGSASHLNGSGDGASRAAGDSDTEHPGACRGVAHHTTSGWQGEAAWPRDAESTGERLQQQSVPGWPGGENPYRMPAADQAYQAYYYNAALAHVGDAAASGMAMQASAWSYGMPPHGDMEGSQAKLEGTSPRGQQPAWRSHPQLYSSEDYRQHAHAVAASAASAEEQASSRPDQAQEDAADSTAAQPQRPTPAQSHHEESTVPQDAKKVTEPQASEDGDAKSKSWISGAAGSLSQGWDNFVDAMDRIFIPGNETADTVGAEEGVEAGEADTGVSSALAAKMEEEVAEAAGDAPGGCHQDTSPAEAEPVAAPADAAHGPVQQAAPTKPDTQPIVQPIAQPVAQAAAAPVEFVSPAIAPSGDDAYFRHPVPAGDDVVIDRGNAYARQFQGQMSDHTLPCWSMETPGHARPRRSTGQGLVAQRAAALEGAIASQDSAPPPFVLGATGPYPVDPKVGAGGRSNPFLQEMSGSQGNGVALADAASSAMGMPQYAATVGQPATGTQVRSLLEQDGLPVYVAQGAGRGWVPKRLCVNGSGDKLYIIEPDANVPSVFLGMPSFPLEDLRRINLSLAQQEAADAQGQGVAWQEQPPQAGSLALEFEEGFLPVQLEHGHLLQGFVDALKACNGAAEVAPTRPAAVEDGEPG
eukprot:TRINITY_DN19616_c0_g2_i1.p1 TRINITY_DN19616_c0_g2~~TRINITY_DN19616_c0_g2_i1.p1  ORF type:complete len:1038 (-),score=243.26 TRINITY_DN19616_c0_g2_i1:179-3292(-)